MSVKRKCPNCDEEIEELQVSRQIEGKQSLTLIDKMEPEHSIEWNEEQVEPYIYTCPMCHVDIEEQTLKEWGVM